MKSVILFFFALLLCTSKTSAQFLITEQEADLSILLDSLRASTTDKAKARWNGEFRALMQKTLEDPAAFTYPFETLRTVGKIDSPDGKVRIFSWNVEQADQSQFYCAFVLKKDDNRPEHKVYELIDNSFMLPPRTDEVVESASWYGALYYQIIPVEKGNKTYYTVLGWDGNTTSSNIKLIDALTFGGNSVKLGAPIFKMGDVTKRRVYFEHSEKSVMSLRWDEDQKRIMFDHLSPETPTMEGFYEYYVPDMSYDAFEFNGTKWILVEDVIGINKDQQVVHVNHFDSKTGETTEEVVENKWIDPTTEGSPASKEVHTAVTPESAAGASDKTAKGDKKDPNNALDAYNGQKRHKKEKTGSGKLPGATSKTKKRK